MSFSSMKEKIGFTKNPMRPGNSDVAFMDFVSFSLGNNDGAKAIRLAFQKDRSGIKETPKQTAASFVDWLIVNQWGEAESATGSAT